MVSLLLNRVINKRLITFLTLYIIAHGIEEAINDTVLVLMFN